MIIHSCRFQKEDWKRKIHAELCPASEITFVSSFRRSHNGLSDEFATKADVHSSRPSAPKSCSSHEIEVRRAVSFLKISQDSCNEIPSASSFKIPETRRESKYQPPASSAVSNKRMSGPDEGFCPPDVMIPIEPWPRCQLAARQNQYLLPAVHCKPRQASRQKSLCGGAIERLSEYYSMIAGSCYFHKIGYALPWLASISQFPSSIPLLGAWTRPKIECEVAGAPPYDTWVQLAIPRLRRCLRRRSTAKPPGHRGMQGQEEPSAGTFCSTTRYQRWAGKGTYARAQATFARNTSPIAPPLKRATENMSTPKSDYRWQNAGTAAILLRLPGVSNSCRAAEKSSTCLCQESSPTPSNKYSTRHILRASNSRGSFRPRGPNNPKWSDEKVSTSRLKRRPPRKKQTLTKMPSST